MENKRPSLINNGDMPELRPLDKEIIGFMKNDHDYDKESLVTVATSKPAGPLDYLNTRNRMKDTSDMNTDLFCSDTKVHDDTSVDLVKVMNHF